MWNSRFKLAIFESWNLIKFLTFSHLFEDSNPDSGSQSFSKDSLFKFRIKKCSHLFSENFSEVWRYYKPSRFPALAWLANVREA